MVNNRRATKPVISRASLATGGKPIDALVILLRGSYDDEADGEKRLAEELRPAIESFAPRLVPRHTDFERLTRALSPAGGVAQARNTASMTSPSRLASERNASASTRQNQCDGILGGITGNYTVVQPIDHCLGFSPEYNPDPVVRTPIGVHRMPHLPFKTRS